MLCHSRHCVCSDKSSSETSGFRYQPPHYLTPLLQTLPGPVSPPMFSPATCLVWSNEHRQFRCNALTTFTIILSNNNKVIAPHYYYALKRNAIFTSPDVIRLELLQLRASWDTGVAQEQQHTLPLKNHFVKSHFQERLSWEERHLELWRRKQTSMRQ